MTDTSLGDALLQLTDKASAVVSQHGADAVALAEQVAQANAVVNLITGGICAIFFHWFNIFHQMDIEAK